MYHNWTWTTLTNLTHVSVLPFTPQKGINRKMRLPIPYRISILNWNLSIKRKKKFIYVEPKINIMSNLVEYLVHRNILGIVFCYFLMNHWLCRFIRGKGSPIVEKYHPIRLWKRNEKKLSFEKNKYPPLSLYIILVK